LLDVEKILYLGDSGESMQEIQGFVLAAVLCPVRTE